MFQERKKKGNFASGLKQHASTHADGVTCTCECHGTRKDEQRRKIQLKKGTAASFRGKFRSSSQNLIQTTTSSLLSLPFQSFRRSIKRPIYIFLLIGLIFYTYRSAAAPYNYNTIMTPLIICLFISILKEFLVNRSRFFLDYFVLRAIPVRVLNRKQPNKKVSKNESSSVSIAEKDENDEFEIFSSSQLEAGDILLIKKDEFVSADVLILDSAERSFDVN